MLGALGRGASGVVWRALHLPSLTLLAVKSIPCFDQLKRHQLVSGWGGLAGGTGWGGEGG